MPTELPTSVEPHAGDRRCGTLAGDSPSWKKEPRMRIPALVAGLALAASVLTGCGGGGSDDTAATDSETYCTQLEADAKYFQAFSGGDPDPSLVGDAIGRVHDLADAAPDEVAADWDVLDATLTDVERTLNEAGISTDDLEGIAEGQLPKGVNMAELSKLLPKLQQLNNPELQDAVKAIRTHAKDECGVTLDSPSPDAG
jgi:hypothetical protein